jgi:hypothetical protein
MRNDRISPWAWMTCSTEADAFSTEHPAAPLRQRFERGPVAPAFNQDDRPRPDGGGQIELHDWPPL